MQYIYIDMVNILGCNTVKIKLIKITKRENLY